MMYDVLTPDGWKWWLELLVKISHLIGFGFESCNITRTGHSRQEVNLSYSRYLVIFDVSQKKKYI